MICQKWIFVENGFGAKLIKLKCFNCKIQLLYESVVLN